MVAGRVQAAVAAAPAVEEEMSRRKAEAWRSRLSCAAAPLDYYRNLRRVRDHLLQHLDAHLSLTDAAGIAALHPKYFSVYFKRKVGMGFGEWVRRVRVEQAQHILETTDMSITNVAFDVGFNDLRTFQRAFKRVTGITPWDYKKHARPQPVRRAGPRRSAKRERAGTLRQ